MHFQLNSSWIKPLKIFTLKTGFFPVFFLFLSYGFHKKTRTDRKEHFLFILEKIL